MRLINEYARVIVAEKPEVLPKIVREVKSKCSGTQLLDEEFLDMGLNDDIVGKLKCITNAITDALKDTKYSKSWDKLKKDLERVGDRIKACRSDNYWEMIK